MLEKSDIEQILEKMGYTRSENGLFTTEVKYCDGHQQRLVFIIKTLPDTEWYRVFTVELCERFIYLTGHPHNSNLILTAGFPYELVAGVVQSFGGRVNQSAENDFR